MCSGVLGGDRVWWVVGEDRAVVADFFPWLVSGATHAHRMTLPEMMTVRWVQHVGLSAPVGGLSTVGTSPSKIWHSGQFAHTRFPAWAGHSHRSFPVTVGPATRRKAHVW